MLQTGAAGSDGLHTTPTDAKSPERARPPSRHPAPCIHPDRRSLAIPGVLSAMIATGPAKLDSGFGNGDCLLVDAARGIFAVADASERHPRASRRLIRRLHGFLAESGDVPGRLAASLEEAYARQKYNHKSTLTGMVIESSADRIGLHLFHGGDSMAVVVRADDGRVLMATRSDMHFAGRYRQRPVVTRHSFDAAAPLRIILASDGFGEVLKTLSDPDANRPAEFSPTFVREVVLPPVAEVAERVRCRLAADPARPFHDDVAVLVIDPCARVGFEGPALTLGGTSPRQEACCAAGFDPKQIGPPIDADRWMEHSEILRKAGFRFLRDPLSEIHTCPERQKAPDDSRYS